jgi:ATP-dependent Clp protease ATP-binding subunit ClpA
MINYTKIIISIAEDKTPEGIIDTLRRYAFPARESLLEVLGERITVPDKIPYPVLYLVPNHMKKYEHLPFPRFLSYMAYETGMDKEQIYHFYNNYRSNATFNIPDNARWITKEAREGQLDPLIGREKELAEVEQVLSNRKKKNPALIGDPGVGKTAIVEGLAQRIVNNEVPLNLIGKEIIELSPSDYTSSQMGPMALRQVLEYLETVPDIILFMDEFHGMNSNNLRTTNALLDTMKPYLARSKMSFIGSTTMTEYREIEKDKAMARRMQTVYINEPTKEENLEILSKLKPIYSQYHMIDINDDIIKNIDEAADLVGGFNPDKSISIMDNVMAKHKTNNNGFPASLNIEEFIDLISEKYRIRKEFLSEFKSAKAYADVFEKHVPIMKGTGNELFNELFHLKKIQQKHNVGSVITVFGKRSAALKVAKGIAKTLDHDEKYLYINGSEFSTNTQYTRIKGAPPGFISYGQPTLFSPLHNRPMPIIIDYWDDIHPLTIENLMAIIKSGTLTTNDNETTNFKNIDFIITRPDAGDSFDLFSSGSTEKMDDEISLLTNIFLVCRNSDKEELEKIAKKYKKNIENYKTVIEKGITTDEFEQIIEEETHESKWIK